MPAGTTIFDAARGLGIDIPTLCHAQHQTPVGVCRVCTVEVKNQRVLAAACVRPAEEGMVVDDRLRRASSARAARWPSSCWPTTPRPARASAPPATASWRRWRAAYGVGAPRFARRPSPRGLDDSSLFIAVDHTACILCDRCIRGCTEVKHNFVIGRTGKGYAAGISFDNDLPWPRSTCVGCGECMVSCPTGALTNRKVLDVDLPHGERHDRRRTCRRCRSSRGCRGRSSSSTAARSCGGAFKPGEVICREGEFGSTAFYVLSGKVEVSIATPLGHGAARASDAAAGARASSACSPSW